MYGCSGASCYGEPTNPHQDSNFNQTSNTQPWLTTITLHIYVKLRSGLPHTGEVTANGQAHSPSGNRLGLRLGKTLHSKQQILIEHQWHRGLISDPSLHVIDTATQTDVDPGGREWRQWPNQERLIQCGLGERHVVPPMRGIRPQQRTRSCAPRTHHPCAEDTPQIGALRFLHEDAHFFTKSARVHSSFSCTAAALCSCEMDVARLRVEHPTTH